MTRKHLALFDCYNCNTRQTAETLFGKWIRNNPELDSKDGYCVVDQDYWIHKFKTYDSRDFQLLMGIEIKTRNGKLSDAQRDTLHAVNQVMRNRRQTPTKDLKYQAGVSAVRETFSTYLKKTVVLRVYGIHLLRFSGLGPDDSDVIEWDCRIINTETLTNILKFDLDPDTLNPIDLRNHHIKRSQHQPSLFECKL